MIKFICLVLPWEVTQLNLTVMNILTAANYLNQSDFKDIKFQISYSNIDNQINWSDSKLTKECTEQMFINSCKLLGKFFEVSYEIDDTLLGCVGHRRREFEKYDYDYCCTFDTDVHFDFRLFKKMLDASKAISDRDKEPHVITPTIPCYWDDSWNIISMLPSRQYNHWKSSLSLFSLPLYSTNDIKLVKIQTYKWSGGFFPCYSKLFLEKYKLPVELGNAYGPDDTYLMFKAHYEKFNKNNPVSQYVLRGLLVFDKRDFGSHFNLRELFDIKFIGNDGNSITISDIENLILNSDENLLYKSN